MQSIDLIRDSLTKSKDRVLARIEDMREHCTVFPTPEEAATRYGYSGIWLTSRLWSSADSCWAKRIRWLTWAEVFDGADVSGDIRRYPPFDQVLATCREVRDSTMVLVNSLSEDDLDQSSANAPAGFEDTFGTYRLCLQYMADHWYMHRGHLADARRAAGVERMWL